MGKTCLKCGHVRTAIDAGTEGECPRCGAIYAKVEAAMAARAAAPATPAAPSLGSKPAAPSPLSAPLSGSRLLVLGAFGVAVIAYMVYADHQSKLTAQVKAQEQVEQRAAKESEERQPRARQLEADRQARAKQEAERRAAMSPSQLREEELRKQFSLWNGSHRATEAAIKAQMHNPASYEHVKTVYADQGPGKGLMVQTTFRGTNAYGAVVTNIAEAKIDDGGRVASLKVNLR